MTLYICIARHQPSLRVCPSLKIVYLLRDLRGVPCPIALGVWRQEECWPPLSKFDKWSPCTRDARSSNCVSEFHNNCSAYKHGRPTHSPDFINCRAARRRLSPFTAWRSFINTIDAQRRNTSHLVTCVWRQSAGNDGHLCESRAPRSPACPSTASPDLLSALR